MRRDHLADDRQSVEDLVAFVRAVIEGHFQNILFRAGREDYAAHVISRKRNCRLQIEFFLGRLGQGDSDFVRSALGDAVDGIDQRLIEVILRLENEPLSRSFLLAG